MHVVAVPPHLPVLFCLAFIDYLEMGKWKKVSFFGRNMRWGWYMLLGLAPCRTWLITVIPVSPCLSLHAQIAVAVGRDTWCAELQNPKDWFYYLTLASLVPSLMNTDLASFHGSMSALPPTSSGILSEKELGWGHQQEINICIPCSQNSSAWNRLPPVLSEACWDNRCLRTHSSFS